jgi:hypothetical protein
MELHFGQMVNFEPVVMMLTLGGRINYADDRVTHAYLANPEGAATLAADRTVDEAVAAATSAANITPTCARSGRAA